MICQLIDDYYKPIRTNNAISSNYIEYESIGDKDKKLTIKEYRDMIRSYLSDITNDHKTQGQWKLWLATEIYSFSSMDSEETHTMSTKSDNIEIMMGNETDEIIEELLNFFSKDIKI